jgi:sigma-B regulation protein RsbU (phosphoserine phosphatase)
VSAPAAARFSEFWKTVGRGLGPDAEAPLPARIARTALALSGARSAALYLREKELWLPGATAGEDGGNGFPLPVPLPSKALHDGDGFWVPLETESDVHGLLGLAGIRPEESSELASFCGPVFGALLAAHRLSRMVKEADFELKARLLELESLYDLGLSLGGQLDLGTLADEVLFRSISLTDARGGMLVLFGENGQPMLSRDVGGALLPLDQVADWKLPEGEAVVNNAASTLPTSGLTPRGCEKCLAVAISVLGRRLGVLAVADKESRDGKVLDFTPTDARLLSLFANQAAGAIETARLHREAIEREKIDRELELAAAIQREILPRFLPEVPGTELAAANLPTRQVGGDYFDLFPLSRGRLGFLVADVSGKGIPAALLVSTVHAAVHLQIDDAKTVAELVERIDRHLQKFSATHKFLTLFFGLLEPDSGLLRYVSAGHNPALVARADGSVERVESTGVPIGMLPNATWREETITLAHGELIAVYTDGLTEAGNEKEEEFGMERLTRLVAASARKPVQELCDVILANVADFASGMPQYDDQTLLVVRRT